MPPPASPSAPPASRSAAPGSTRRPPASSRSRRPAAPSPPPQAPAAEQPDGSSSTRPRGHAKPSQTPGGSSGGSIMPTPQDTPSRGVPSGVIAAVTVIVVLVVAAVLFQLWRVRKRRVQKHFIAPPAARSPFADPFKDPSSDSGDLDEKVIPVDPSRSTSALREKLAAFSGKMKAVSKLSSRKDEMRQSRQLAHSDHNLHNSALAASADGSDESLAAPGVQNLASRPDLNETHALEGVDTELVAAAMEYSTSMDDISAPSNPPPRSLSPPEYASEASVGSIAASSDIPRSTSSDTLARRASLNHYPSSSTNYVPSLHSRQSSRYSLRHHQQGGPLPSLPAVRGAPHLPHVRAAIDIVLPAPLGSLPGQDDHHAHDMSHDRSSNNAPGTLTRNASRVSLRSTRSMQTMTDPWADAMMAARRSKEASEHSSQTMVEDEEAPPVPALEGSVNSRSASQRNRKLSQSLHGKGPSSWRRHMLASS